MESQVDLGEYIFTRLKQIGVRSAFGVPGESNLRLLDYLYGNRGLGISWIGCCNELNAAYAADGYGRVRGIPGILITTYGVGELSALNGISGAFAEHSPILHIVGTPASAATAASNLHGLPGRGRERPSIDAYFAMSAPVRCACAVLNYTTLSSAPDLIDSTILECWKRSQPAYLYVPSDLPALKVSGKNLQSPLQLTINNDKPGLDAQILDEILKLIYSSTTPIFIVDTLAERHRATSLVRKLVNKTRFNAFTTLLGKGIIDETNPSFVGVYNGSLSLPGIKETVLSSDLIINIGPLLSPETITNTSTDNTIAATVTLHPDYISINSTHYDNVHFIPILSALLSDIDISRLPRHTLKPSIAPPPAIPSKADISQSYFVEAISNFLMPNDIFVVETGTFQYSLPDVKFKKNTKSITQFFFSSIGFALPATLGVSIANHETNGKGRVILVEGDGSAQMTIQELGTMIKLGLTPTIFLINNDGYSMERAHSHWDPEMPYNNICPKWKWTELLSAFGGDDGINIFSVTIKTKNELDSLLSNDNEFLKSNKIQLIEIVMDVLDIPWRLSEEVKLQADKDTQLYKEFINSVK